MNKRLLFVFNPNSGKQALKSNLFDIIDIFTKGGYEVTVYPTQAPDEAYNIIKEKAADFDTVVVSGGDGTLNEGVRGILSLPPDLKKAIGYIPTGTTNDFAHSRGLSMNMLEAAKNIVSGKTFEGDVGIFNESKCFNYVAACGAFTDVSYDTPQNYKNMFGHMAYFFEGIKRLTNLETHHIHLTCEQAEIEDDFFLVIVLNSTRMAGVKLDSMIDVDLADGLFEIILVKRPVNIMQIYEVFDAVINGREDASTFKLIRTSKAQIEFLDEIKWTLDGEYGGTHKKVSIEVAQGAMKYIG